MEERNLQRSNGGIPEFLIFKSKIMMLILKKMTLSAAVVLLCKLTCLAQSQVKALVCLKIIPTKEQAGTAALPGRITPIKAPFPIAIEKAK